MARAFKKPLKSPIKPKEKKPGQTIQGEVDLPFLLLTVLLVVVGLVMLLSASYPSAIYDLKGDARRPIQEVELKNVTVGEVTEFVKRVVNAEQVTETNVNYTKITES